MQLRPKTARRGVVSRILAVVALGAVVMAACSGDDDDTAGGETSTTSTTTSTSTSSTTTTEPPNPSAAAGTVWRQAWQDAGEAETSPDDLAAIASPAAAERLVATLHAGADPDGEFSGRTVTNHPSVEENDDGTFAIQDCLLINPPVAVGQANWYSGTVAEVDGRLVVTGVEPEVVTGCVPAAVAEKAFAAYDQFQQFHAAGVRPGNDQFEAMVTGEYREFVLPWIEQNAAEGRVFRDVGLEHFPEITEFRAGFVKIIDCANGSPDTDFYDAETGEPLNELRRPDGPNDAFEVHLVWEDDRWKVSSVGDERGSTCQQAPTPLAIAEVG